MKQYYTYIFMCQCKYLLKNFWSEIAWSKQRNICQAFDIYGQIVPRKSYTSYTPTIGPKSDHFFMFTLHSVLLFL